MLFHQQTTHAQQEMAKLLLLFLVCHVCVTNSESVQENSGNANLDQAASSSSGGWIIGVGLTTLGTVVAAVGNLMVTTSHKMDNGSPSFNQSSGDQNASPSRGSKRGERRSHRHSIASASNKYKSHDESDDEKVKRPVKWTWTSPAFICWSIGNLNITIIGTILSLASYAYASPALLSPLAGLTIVWNAGLATLPIFGGHPFSWSSLPSTLNVLFGCVLIVLAGPRNDTAYTAAEILALVPSFTSLLVVVVLGGTGAYLLRATKSSNNQVRCYASAGLAGLIGGLSNLLAKASVEVVKEALGGLTIFVGVTAILFVVLAVTVAISQLTWLNHSLERYSPLLVVPIYQASLLSWSTLASGLFFGDLLGLSILQYVTFTVGLGLIITGVVQLGRATPSVPSGSGAAAVAAGGSEKA